MFEYIERVHPVQVLHEWEDCAEKCANPGAIFAYTRALIRRCQPTFCLAGQTRIGPCVPRGMVFNETTLRSGEDVPDDTPDESRRARTVHSLETI